MADGENEIPFERVYQALDLMVQAGWISAYVKNAEKTAIRWTDQGKQVMKGVFIACEELGVENLDQELWWAVAFIANMKFGTLPP